MTSKAKTAEAKAPRARKVKAAEPLIAWKGFDKDLKCLGYQFKVGETYTHEGKIEACSSGFHVCDNPADTWSYYELGSGNRFCRVHWSGKTDQRKGDSKRAVQTLFVETEVTLGEMIKAAVKYEIADAFAKAKTDKDTNASSGHSATNASSGHSATNASSGHSARNASSGDSATNASSGDSARNASSGTCARNASSGTCARNASSGTCARNASSGDSATNASSGDSATNASSGDAATNASSGDSATNASSGNYATNASSGTYATNEATGENSVIAAAGLNSRAKGVKGTAIALPYVDSKDQIRFACGVAGEDDVPADTWLKADNGRLVIA